MMRVTGRTELFVGRDSELSELAAILRDGRGGTVVVAGEAGVGKTRLVTQALQVDAPAAVSGSCWQGDGAPAFWPWRQVIRACLASEAGVAWRLRSEPLADEVASLVSGGDRRRARSGRLALRAVRRHHRLLRASGRSNGLTIVLDDLQWADDASLRLLSFAVRALHGEPVVVIGIYRDDELGPDHRLSKLLAELAGHARHLRLTGLDVNALTSLARAWSDEHDQVDRNWCRSSTA